MLTCQRYKHIMKQAETHNTDKAPAVRFSAELSRADVAVPFAAPSSVCTNRQGIPMLLDLLISF